jgi:hypothetical protein
LISFPGPPVDVVAVAGNGEAVVSWSPPVDDGGTPVLRYEIVVYPGMRVLSTDGNVASFIITGLTNGSAYTFTVATVNSVGISNPSTPTAPVSPAGPPGAPIDVRASRGERDASIEVTWNAPADDGGLPITGYLVLVEPPDGPPVSVDASSLTVAFHGLRPAIPYSFSVQALNDAGGGPVAAAGEPVTITAPPELEIVFEGPVDQPDRTPEGSPVVLSPPAQEGQPRRNGRVALTADASPTPRPASTVTATPAPRPAPTPTLIPASGSDNPGLGVPVIPQNAPNVVLGSSAATPPDSLGGDASAGQNESGGTPWQIWAIAGVVATIAAAAAGVLLRARQNRVTA